MRTENRQPVRKLDQFHRRGPARIDLDGVGAPVARDEIDAVDTHKTELAANHLAQPARIVEQRAIRSARAEIIGLREDAAAVLISRRTECRFTGELLREPERHRTIRGRRENDRSRYAAYEFVQVT